MHFSRSIFYPLLLLLLPLACAEAPPVERDFDTGISDADTGDLPDAEEEDEEEEEEQRPPPSWDCAPDLALDHEFYLDLEELSGPDLADALFFLVDGHRDGGYNLHRDYLFGPIETQDDGMLECVYTGRRVEPDGTRTPDRLNTEHTWPQSRGADFRPARSDLHHLFPCDEDANNARAAYEFGHVSCNENTCPWHQGGSLLGPSRDDDRELVFQVRPQRRGDVARAIFYFSLRYDFSISSEEEAVLRAWNCEDPPDTRERGRNALIEMAQENRNPFIDRPDFVDRIPSF